MNPEFILINGKCVKVLRDPQLLSTLKRDSPKQENIEKLKLTKILPETQEDSPSTSKQIGENLTFRDDNQKIVIWNNTATKVLIETYSKFQHLFKSSTLRSNQIWNKMAEAVTETGFPCNGTQCENRWKYLRKQYLRKKDNMGPKCTGSKTVNFDYFEDIDEILGVKPNVTPLTEASSLRGCDFPTEEVDDQLFDGNNMSEENFSNKKKATSSHSNTSAKKTKLAKEIDIWKQSFNEQLEKKEAARERRHEEMLKQQQEAIAVYKDLMTQLIKKL